MALAQRFAGRVAAVTGGAGGIGEATVRRLHAEGAAVAILDVAEAAGRALAADLNAQREGSAAFVLADVSTEARVLAAFDAAVSALGPIDVLVAMAAKFIYGEVHLASESSWDEVLAVNVKGAAASCKAVLPAMRAARRGAIVLVSSITGGLAFPAFVPYSATKAALIQMTRDIALDNGPHGVRVNCCAPGPIFTQGGTVAHAASEGRAVEDVCAELASEVSLRRMGTVDECAAAIAFLASDDAAYVTGTTLHVDGGFTRK
jgi:NAD(P)-dependent dehydrogenase (short-subunit alcohol dehydrogenase family)